MSDDAPVLTNGAGALVRTLGLLLYDIGSFSSSIHFILSVTTAGANISAAIVLPTPHAVRDDKPAALYGT